MSDLHGEVLDLEVIDGLRASVQGDTAFVIELIEAFLADSSTQIDAIEAAVADGDVEAVVRPAHTLKSASATLGVVSLSAAGRTLEMAARSGSLDGDDARAAVASIRDDWEAAAAALNAWSASNR